MADVITFSCGHTDKVALLGKMDERRRKIAYFEKYGECSACRKAAAEKAEEAEDAACREALAGDTLPALDGSAKQVAWADRLRLRIGRDLVGVRAYIQDKPEAAASPEGQAALALIATVLLQAASRWWIDNAARHNAAEVLVALLGRRVAAGKIDAALADRMRPVLVNIAYHVSAHRGRA